MSLKCICCKTIEHILVSNINTHLAFQSILVDCQHDLQRQRSCETQLVQFYLMVPIIEDTSKPIWLSWISLRLLIQFNTGDYYTHCITEIEGPHLGGSARGSLSAHNKLFEQIFQITSGLLFDYLQMVVFYIGTLIRQRIVKFYKKTWIAWHVGKQTGKWNSMLRNVTHWGCQGTLRQAV